ncbi:MAG TPA: hypothetical protein VIT62_02530 [Lysobacter sp.]
MKKVEIRVIPVTRFVVARYCVDGNGASSSPLGEFDNEFYAERVAAAARAFEGTPDCEAMDADHMAKALKRLAGDPA